MIQVLQIPINAGHLILNTGIDVKMFSDIKINHSHTPHGIKTPHNY